LVKAVVMVAKAVSILAAQAAKVRAAVVLAVTAAQVAVVLMDMGGLPLQHSLPTEHMAVAVAADQHTTILTKMVTSLERVALVVE
jgi:acid phosphatase family membrane protein YuiD